MVNTSIGVKNLRARPVGKTSLASIALRAMATRDAQRCLASGSGRWEPIADWSGPPYTLRPNTYESRLSAYAPHLCDRGKTSSRPAVKWRWVPEGPGCSALRLPADTHVLTTAFCRRFAGSSILVVGESVQAWLPPPTEPWTQLDSRELFARACPGASVRCARFPSRCTAVALAPLPGRRAQERIGNGGPC